MSPLDPPLGLAVDTVLFPDPLVPTVTLLTVVPVRVPPVIATESESCVDNVPRELIAFVTAVVTKAVVAICVLLVPAEAVGELGTPVKAGPSRSALELTAASTAISSASTSDPLISLPGSPEVNPSLVVKFVDLLYDDILIP